MLNDYIRKIRKTLNEATFIVPTELEIFYTLLAICCHQIPEQEITPAIIEHLATINQLAKSIVGAGSELKRAALHSQLAELLAPFKKYQPKTSNEIYKRIHQHFMDQQFLAKVIEERRKAEHIVDQYKLKNNRIHIHGAHEISFNFWVNTFKADYAVHFDVFWTAFVDYLHKDPFYRQFVSESSRETIHAVLDPSRKYYITSANINELFIKMSELQFMQTLAEHTSLKRKSKQFQSHGSIFLKYWKKSHAESSVVESNFPEGTKIEVNGCLVSCQEIKNVCKYSPTIRFGSLLDSDFWIKSKYISRRQFMLIEEPVELQQTIFGFQTNGNNSTKIENSNEGGELSHYYLVCLSPSNYTCVTYPYPREAKPGMIFKMNGEMVQITKISDSFAGMKPETQPPSQMTQLTGSDDEYEKTLEQLPTNKSYVLEKQLEYKYLTGGLKNQKGVLLGNEQTISLSNGQQIKISQKDKRFYFPAGLEILCKSANQVLSGHLSDKIKLEYGMQITLEELIFECQSQ